MAKMFFQESGRVGNVFFLVFAKGEANSSLYNVAFCEVVTDQPEQIRLRHQSQLASETFSRAGLTNLHLLFINAGVPDLLCDRDCKVVAPLEFKGCLPDGRTWFLFQSQFPDDVSGRDQEGMILRDLKRERCSQWLDAVESSRVVSSKY